MEVGGVAIGASTITSVFTATLRISQAVYELKAVGEQTRDLLDTTKHIDDATRNVRFVRRQKSALLTATEKEWIDREIKNSEKAVSDVAALIEPARVDMQTKSKDTNCNNTKNIRFKNRVMFVLRDSPNVAVQLTKLSIATQGLNTAMGVLCNREGHGGQGKFNGGTVKRPDRRSSSPTRKPPPPYELHEFMNRRRTTSAVPRRKELNHKASSVSFVDEDCSGNESVPLSTSRSQATLRTKSSWATMEDLGNTSEHGQVETKYEASGSAAPTFSSIFRDAPYLERFDKSPACIPVLTFSEATPSIGPEAHPVIDGHDTGARDAWRLETLQVLQEQQDIPTPALKAEGPSRYLSPNRVASASVSQTSLDTGMARMTISGNSSNHDQQYAHTEELLPSHPPLVPHKSEPIALTLPSAYPPSIPLRSTPFQSQYQQTSSTHSLQDRYVHQASSADPQHSLPRPSPFHFLTPQMRGSEDGKLTTWGENKPNEATNPAATSTTINSPFRTHQPSPPYPYTPPSAPSFPPLTHALSDPPPQHSTPALPPRRKPIPTATPPSPPASHLHPSLAETVTQNQNLLYYKPLPNLPFGRNPSVTSVTSTASEPASGVGVDGARISRGKMWLEHHAERAFAMRESAGGPLSGGFLAPLPPQQRVREV